MEKKLRSALIVDDEPEIVELIGAASVPYVAEYSAAYDVQTALSLFENSEFDVVICDIRMPGESGVDLLEKIRAISPETPFIIISGALELHYLVRAVKLGLTDVIEKPFTSADIGRALEKTINARLDQYLKNLKKLNLTTRQIEIVENLLKGKSNKEISNSVGITEQAVKYHISQLLKQFNVFTRRDLRERIHRQIGESD